MAAGLKVKTKNIGTFRARINEVTKGGLPINPTPYMRYDSIIRLKDTSESTLSDIEKIEPFGMGNPRPLFILEDVSITKSRVTRDGQHLQLTLRKDNKIRNVIGFWMAFYKDIIIDEAQKFDVLFFIERSKYNTTQLVLKDIKEVKLT